MFIYTKTCNLVLSDVLIVFIIDGALPLYARNNNRAHRSVILKVLYRVLLLNGRWPFCRGPPACLPAQLQFIMCFYSKTHSNSLQLQAFEKKKKYLHGRTVGTSTKTSEKCQHHCILELRKLKLVTQRASPNLRQLKRTFFKMTNLSQTTRAKMGSSSDHWHVGIHTAKERNLFKSNRAKTKKHEVGIARVASG